MRSTMPASTSSDDRRPAHHAGNHVAGRQQELPALSAKRLGIDPRFTGSHDDGRRDRRARCVQIAAMAVANGMANTVACIFADTARTGGTRFGGAAGGEDSWASGACSATPPTARMGCRRHMALYGTRSEHLGWIAVACRKHASMNPNAVMREPITLDDHQNSR